MNFQSTNYGHFSFHLAAFRSFEETSNGYNINSEFLHRANLKIRTYSLWQSTKWQEKLNDFILNLSRHNQIQWQSSFTSKLRNHWNRHEIHRYIQIFQVIKYSNKHKMCLHIMQCQLLYQLWVPQDDSGIH